MTSEAFDVTQLALLGEASDCLEDIALLVWDEERNYVAANRAACQLVGRWRAEILQMKVGDLSEDGVDALFEEVQKRGVHAGAMRSPNGEIGYVTCRTKVAGLPYMVSVCWPRRAA
jgi:PAS domain-containing protein